MRREPADFGPWSGRPNHPAAELAMIIEGQGAGLVWGLSTTERIERMAARRGLRTRNPEPGDPVLRVNGEYVFDPILLDWALASAGRAVFDGETPVLSREDAEGRALERLDLADPVYFSELFKSEPPLLVRLTASNRALVEKALYGAAYRGVTDALTKYLWRDLAFLIARACSRAGISPNEVTLTGLSLCVAATALFYTGRLWAGLACAAAFMVLDTVDGKLARCTISSSRTGDVLDHGLDLIHPPFWWAAWAHGLSPEEAGLPEAVLTLAVVASVTGYLLQRAVEAAFLLRYGIQIHLWRPFDSRLKLVTAQRNTMVVMLAVSLAAARPDWGLAAIALWTWICLPIHATRLAQAMWSARRGPIQSWLLRPGPQASTR